MPGTGRCVIAQSCLRDKPLLEHRIWRDTSPASRRLKGGLVCHQSRLLSEERGERKRQEGDEEDRRKVAMKKPDRKCTCGQWE